MYLSKHITYITTVLIVILFAGSLHTLSAQETPQWVESKGETPWLSDSKVLSGFGMAAIPRKEKPGKYLTIAEENAKKHLAEKINVQVKSVTRTHKQQTDLHFEQKLESEIVSLTNIEFPGLKKEVYTDTKNNMAYCMVYVPVNMLVTNYQYKLFELHKEIEGYYFTAGEYEKNGQKAQALENYLQCFTLLPQISELQTVLLGLGHSPTYPEKVNLFNIKQAVNQLITKVEDLNDLAFFIAFAFQQQSKNDSLSGIIVSPLTYRNTGMASEFSRQFRETLENNIITHNKWKTFPIKKYNPSIENMLKIRYAIKGTYWETEDIITLNVYLAEIVTGIKQASIEYEINRSMVNEQVLPLIPLNYAHTYNNQASFNAARQLNAGLQIEAYTNKGKTDLVYTEGETMTVYIKTNIPCYLQLVYQFNDSSQVLFLNNQYIDITQVNKMYELPFEFICSAPFGVESMYIFATDQAISSIETTTINGYPFIQGNINNIIDNYLNLNRHALYDKEYLIITTLPN